MYQIRIKEYKGTAPVREEVWRLENNRGIQPQGKQAQKIQEETQTKEMSDIPVMIRCTWKSLPGLDTFRIQAEALEDLKLPASVSLEYSEEKGSMDRYVFAPAAVYNGNRMESRKIPYPPYRAEKTADGWEPVITDIPRLEKDGREGKIQFLSGDMSTPAFGYCAQREGKGLLLLAEHEENGRYTGFTVKENEEEICFAVSSPGVREEKVYFFGELPDGSGFYPTCDYPSDDEGVLLKKGEILNLEAECHTFRADSLNAFFEHFNSIRENMEKGEEFYSIPFSRAYETIKEKYMRMNFSEEGYFRVGTTDVVPGYWQAGWVGGGMNTYAFLLEDKGTAREQSISTLKFITDRLQRQNGWYAPMYAKGQFYGDAFPDAGKAALLVRKDADLLYFMLKHAFFLQDSGKMPEGMEESIARQAQAFVRVFEKNGQLGQFIDMETEEILVGDTASAAIAPAGLALAYEYFGEQKYLAAAEQLGDLYWNRYLKKGITNGGPGEICQAPDSESAFGLLESCVQLYETTGKEKWLQAAEEAFELAVTWVVSYDFHFPEKSSAAKLGAHTRGTVFANAQNKHSAPGICTLSGSSMLKLYRFTGKEKYLEWMSRISHAVSQFVSLEDRPVDTLAGRPLPAGYINERVQMSDWEGKRTVGEFLCDSNWPETTMLLTYVEIPGIYVDLDRNVVKCSDHVHAEVTGEKDGKISLKLRNPTSYDAVVTVLTDHSMERKRLGYSWFAKMRKIQIGSGEELQIEV